MHAARSEITSSGKRCAWPHPGGRSPRPVRKRHLRSRGHAVAQCSERRPARPSTVQARTRRAPCRTRPPTPPRAGVPPRERVPSARGILRSGTTSNRRDGRPRTVMAQLSVIPQAVAAAKTAGRMPEASRWSIPFPSPVVFPLLKARTPFGPATPIPRAQYSGCPEDA
jgi:hypothetical protein